MQWDNPSWLLAWWLLPVVPVLLLLTKTWRRAAMSRFAEPAVWDRLLPQPSPARSIVKALAVVLGLTMLITAAAGPKWGVHYETVPTRGVDLFVLLDVSRSMLAEDVAPSRLERAKSDIRDLLQHLHGDRVGLITFAGAAVMQVPLTTDHRYFLSSLEEVDTNSAPRGGTLIGDAIRKALASLEPRGDRDQVLVLITDGEDHDSFPAEAARQAAEQGVKIISVGLGDSEEGRRIPISDKQGKRAYLQYDGQEIWSKMDEKLLNDIALSTHGAYIPAKTRAYDLGQIYEEHLAKLTRGEMTSQSRKRYGERYQWFLLAGLAFLTCDMLLPRFRRNSGDAS